MHETNMPKNNETAFLAAAVLSLAAHCMVAAVLMQLVQGEPAIPLPQVITVDIGNPLPAVKSGPAPMYRRDRKTAARREPEPIRDVRRDPLPVPQPESSADRPIMTTVSPVGSVTVRGTSAPLPAYHPEPSRGDRPTHDAAQLKGSSTQAGTVPADIAIVAADYLARLRGLIERQKDYPVAARRGHLQGTVRIRCALARNGEVITVMVFGSSGHDILDNAALRAFRAAGRFPQVPAGVPGDRIVFELPVVFRMTGD